MDYSINSFNNISNQSILFPGFIYNDERFFAKLSVFFKSICLIFYISTLSACNNPDFLLLTMIIAMLISTINNARYELAHFMRYGTFFSSINDFEIWKKKLYPNLRFFFSIIEIAIKIVFFIKNYPLSFNFQNPCEIGESMFKIHIIIILIVYSIFSFLSICILLVIFSSNYSPRQRNIQNQTIISSSSLVLVNNSNEECCICMDTNNSIQWAMLPCGHKFHGTCISMWLTSNQTCPVCRLNFIFV